MCESVCVHCPIWICLMSLALKLRVACLFVRSLSIRSAGFLVSAYVQHSSHKPIILRQQNNLYNWHNEHECTCTFSSNIKRWLTCRAITCCSAFMHFCTTKTVTHIPTIIHTIKTAVTLLTCTYGSIPNTKQSAFLQQILLRYTACTQGFVYGAK